MEIDEEGGWTPVVFGEVAHEYVEEVGVDGDLHGCLGVLLEILLPVVISTIVVKGIGGFFFSMRRAFPLTLKHRRGWR